MKNPLTKLQKETDKKLQLKIKELFKKCEVCGKECQVGHHFFPKSIASILRYDFDNVVHICNSCHFKHHIQGDPKIHATIIKNRGKLWYDKLEKKSHLYNKVDKQFYLKAQEDIENQKAPN